MLREVELKLELCIFSKVDCSNYNFIRFDRVFLRVKTVNQLNLYQVGSKPYSLSIEELYTNVVFEFSLIVRGG